MPAPSLVSMTQRECARNIASLQDVGEISYDLIRPILKKIDNPEQLRNLEITSPHIADHDAELWRAFIARDIPDWREKMIEPKNPRSWWKVYRKLLHEDQKAKEEQEEQLRATMMGIEKEKEENKVNVVRGVIAEPKRQAAFVDGKPNPNVRCFGETVSVKKPALKNAKTGSQIMSALRRQSAMAAKQKGLHVPQPGVIRPSAPSASSQIREAPRSMMLNQSTPSPRLPSQASMAHTTAEPKKVFVSRNTSATDKAIEAAKRAEQVKKERRERALANGTSNPRSQSPLLRPTARSPPISNNDLASPPKPPVQASQFTAQTLQPTISKPSTTTSAPTESEKPASPTKPLDSAPLDSPRAALRAIADSSRRLSPSPAPVVRKRPATPVSVFMPTKKRKV